MISAYFKPFKNSSEFECDITRFIFNSSLVMNLLKYMCIVHVRLCATGSVCILSFIKQGDNIQQVKRNMNQKEESCK